MLQTAQQTVPENTVFSGLTWFIFTVLIFAGMMIVLFLPRAIRYLLGDRPHQPTRTPTRSSPTSSSDPWAEAGRRAQATTDPDNPPPHTQRDARASTRPSDDLPRGAPDFFGDPPADPNDKPNADDDHTDHETDDDSPPRPA